MKRETIADFLSDLNLVPEPGNTAPPRPAHSRAAVTIWLAPDTQARYERLQRITRKQFGKTMRAILIAAMDEAESQVS